MKKISHYQKASAIILFISVMTLLCSCNSGIDEFKFKGYVVGAEMCTSSQIGYAIAIVTPDSIGATFNTSVGKYENVVMAYKASRIVV